MGGLLMFFVWRVPFKNYSTFSAALKFGSKFAFETNFCKFDLCDDPIP
jgi:hypothetical protein